MMKYAANWNTIRTKTLSKSHRCNWCIHRKARVVHHVKYTRSPLRRILGVALGHDASVILHGLEIPGWDVFPVCYRCHENSYGRSSNKKSLHYVGKNPKWIKVNSTDPYIVLNHNVFWVRWRLRLTWFILTNQVLFLILFGAIVFYTIGGLVKLTQ